MVIRKNALSAGLGWVRPPAVSDGDREITTVNSFEEFWAIYPRKVARKDAQRMWDRLTAEQKFAAAQALPLHVRYWAAAGRTKETTPHAASWLNGERWTDELEMPEAPEAAQWWKTSSGIEARARQVGMTPRAGESHHELKARILAKERAA